MIRLSVFCPACGKWLQRLVDEDCPPSSLSCACGIRFSLEMEKGPPPFVPGGARETRESGRQETLFELYRTIEAEREESFTI